ncbi:MAG: FAD-containing monooxygenase EthA, partial [Gammaproteobacteria bacterium]|nr:FAD-containing monooxygenase EthA [Gammaproteobacteria bacterium]
FFEAMKAGKASVVTDNINKFDEEGVVLESGERLDADLVVTATGLKIQLFGGLKMSVDGSEVKANDAYVYKGMMLSGVPNTFLAVGYTNASWTLKVDLTHRYATRLINYADNNGYTKINPQVKRGMSDIPLLNLSSGYIQRAENDLPKQATRKPWRLNQNYLLDTLALKFAPVGNEELNFS